MKDKEMTKWQLKEMTVNGWTNERQRNDRTTVKRNDSKDSNEWKTKKWQNELMKDNET